MALSALAETVYRRTYSRPVGDGFESWDDTIKRVTDHSCIRLMEQAGMAPVE